VLFGLGRFVLAGFEMTKGERLWFPSPVVKKSRIASSGIVWEADCGKVHWVLSGDHVTRITRSRAERLRRSRYCDPDILVPEARDRSRARPRTPRGGQGRD
jgi:hypothetical protein